MPRIASGRSVTITLPTGLTVSISGTGLARLIVPGSVPQQVGIGRTVSYGPFPTVTTLEVAGVGGIVEYTVNKPSTAPAQPFKAAALLGDSITAQHETPVAGTAIVGANGFWNWANWLTGAPFEFECNLGVSGSVAADIFSRIYAIPSHIDTVFVCAGDNDIEGVSGSANAAQIAAAVDALIGGNGSISQGLQALRSMGKNIALATIPPRNTWVAGDSRVQVVAQVNAWIRLQEATGLVDRVCDVFSLWVDPAQPTAAVFRTNYSTDGTHPSNIAGLVGGQSFIDGMQYMYSITSAISRWTDMRQNQTQHIGAMRVIGGVSSTISTGGTGTAATDMAGGWRSLRNAGTPTWVCSIENYEANPNYVGPMSIVQGYGEKAQRLDITSTAASDDVRVQLNTQFAANVNPGIAFGDEFVVSCEVEVINPVALNQAYVQGAAFTTAGTSPADQPYGSSLSQVRSTAGINSVAGTDYAYPNGFRAVMRSKAVRVPQNVNGTVAAAAQFYMNAAFNAAGSATVKWGRPQFWRRF